MRRDIKIITERAHLRGGSSTTTRLPQPYTVPADINYRNLTDAELCVEADNRIATLRRFIPQGSLLWEEVLYRLQRTCGGTGPVDTKKGDRQGNLILGRTG